MMLQMAPFFRRLRIAAPLLAALLIASPVALGDEPKPGAAAGVDNWPGQESKWHGYSQFHFTVGDRPCYVVVPKQPAAGRPWVWRATFPDYHPEPDVALLGKGVYVGYLNTSDMLGSPKAIAEVEKFYDYLTTRHALASKAALEGVSRGGLLVYNFALRHPDRVACIYCDTPVLDFKSWPGGLGKGLGSAGDWKLVLKVYGMTDAEARKYAGNPVDNVAPLAAARIPILHIVSENDHVVPPAENTYLMRRRLQKLGGSLEVISIPQGTAESHGHHFAYPNSTRAAEFILSHSGVPKSQ